MSLAMTIAGPVEGQSGQYRLVGPLGQGGFAQVYLGRHVYNHTIAAIKVLDSGPASEEELENFYAEAYMLASLNHRHIVRVLDFGLEQEPPFLVMEYAPNGTLRQFFQPGVCQPLHAILPFVLQIADALQYLHEKDIVHCDVKPENILLGPGNEAWLSDFGIATKYRAFARPIVPESRGTACYAAPEQIEGQPEPASDQYTLAVLIYEWLCGKCPYEGAPYEICMQHLYAPVPRLRDKASSLSPAVERVIQQALAKDPRQRFARVTDFTQALREAAHSPFRRPFLQRFLEDVIPEAEII